MCRPYRGLIAGRDHGFFLQAIVLPAVVEPEGGQHGDIGCFVIAVMDIDPDEDVAGVLFRVADGDVEVFLFIEDAGVEDLVFRLLTRAFAVLLQQLFIGEFLLRVFVQVFHVVVSGRIVQIVVEFLDVLAVISFGITKPEKTFFQHLVFPVPERYREAQVLKEIGDAAETVLAPEIGPAMSLVVGEIMPGIAIGAIIFSYCSPLSLTQIRSPLF